MESRADHQTRFKPLGEGVSRGTSKSIGIRLPVEIIEAVESAPGGRQTYIRKAIADALRRDGLMPQNPRLESDH